MKQSMFVCLAVMVGAMVSAVPSSAAEGSIEAGRSKSLTCAACHGSDGNSATPDFPSLAGQNQRYIVDQLKAMKSGLRPVPLMAGLVSDMSGQDMADLGAFYAAQKPKVGKAAPDLAEVGRILYRGGDAAQDIAACASCHGAAGTGMPAAGFPSLAGQHAKYTEAQLRAYRAVGRGDDVGPYRKTGGDTQVMQTVASKLSDAQVKALASYIQGLYSPE